MVDTMTTGDLTTHVSRFCGDYSELERTIGTISRFGEGDQIDLRLRVGNLKSELTDIVLLAVRSLGSNVELLERVFLLLPTTRKIPSQSQHFDSSNPFNDGGGVFQPMEHQEVISSSLILSLFSYSRGEFFSHSTWLRSWDVDSTVFVTPALASTPPSKCVFSIGEMSISRKGGCKISEKWGLQKEGGFGGFVF